MKIAYADPPYIGQAKKHYGEEEIDHEALVHRLCEEFPDGWGLSCSSPSLRILLPLCPKDVRVGAWVKPFGIFKPNVNPAYVWEPVIFRGGRKGDRKRKTVRDWVSCNITLKKGLVGVKPEGFCFCEAPLVERTFSQNIHHLCDRCVSFAVESDSFLEYKIADDDG